MVATGLVLGHHSRAPYPDDMPKTAVTPETLALRAFIDARRDELEALLAKYAGTNPKLFGRDDIDIFPVQLLKRPISASALEDAIAL